MSHPFGDDVTWTLKPGLARDDVLRRVAALAADVQTRVDDKIFRDRAVEIARDTFLDPTISVALRTASLNTTLPLLAEKAGEATPAGETKTAACRRTPSTPGSVSSTSSS
ncbi:MAG TPA: hypothetical protein VEK57_19650 [Thermoanaerobaculia bacterium]|nr:hypothetical protein [Thermoanaerobaculia bacterium]